MNENERFALNFILKKKNKRKITKKNENEKCSDEKCEL